jgi:hypothetical protein
MAVIDHREALQWAVDWGMPSPRAKSLEPFHGSCFTSTFVLFSLAGVRLFRGRSALVSDEVLSFLYGADAAVNSSVCMRSTVTTPARFHIHQYQLKEQGLRACDSYSSRKLHNHSITPKPRCALCVYSIPKKARYHL